MDQNAPYGSETAAVLSRVREGLSAVAGVTALALGGSQARGTARPDSDIDIGLYYEPDRRPDFDQILAAVTALDDRPEPAGYGGYGEWGPWINGGIWSMINGVKVDILLRDLDRVRHVVRDCAGGVFEICYQAGHPHGFASTIYAGEIHHGIAFFDPENALSGLRALTDPYPEPLARAVVARFGWEAGFALANAQSPARRGDTAYVCGCAFRAVACLTQVIFAAQRQYLPNEKGSVAIAGKFAVAPVRYEARVTTALAKLSGDPADLTTALAQLRELHAEVTEAVADTPDLS